MIRTIIIEDEAMSRIYLKKLLSDNCPQLSLIGMAGSVEEGIAIINELNPELVFLDIELQTGTSFDILKGVAERNFKCIFTTAYDHYSINILKISGVNYLLKPIDSTDLKDSIIETLKAPSGYYKSALELLLNNICKNDDLSINLSTKEGMTVVSLKDIYSIEANGVNTILHCKNKTELLIYKNVNEFELLLREYNFYRSTNNYLINIAEIKGISKEEDGFLILNNETKVPISSKKKEEILQLLSSRMK